MSTTTKKTIDKLYYFTPSDIQVARVDRQCIVRFCDAFTKFANIVKVVSVRINLSKYEEENDDLYSLYGIEKKIEFVLLGSRIHQDNRNLFSKFSQLFIYSLYSLREFSPKKNNGNIAIYLKNYHFFLVFLLINLFRRKKLLLLFEAHRLPRNSFQKSIFNHPDGIIANSYRLAKKLKNMLPARQYQIIGTHQGVNLNLINNIRLSKTDARKRLGLPFEKFLVIYTGKVYYGYKEIEYYIEAAKLLGNDVEFIIVGGREDHVQNYKNKCADIGNIKFISFVKPAEVFYYQFAADVLLLYYPSGIDINEYRSPGKIFEYMASGAPMIVADYPVLEEIVQNNESAYFVEKNNPHALSDAVKKLKTDKQLSNKLSTNALKQVERFTWESRAKLIYDFIIKLSNKFT